MERGGAHTRARDEREVNRWSHKRRGARASAGGSNNARCGREGMASQKPGALQRASRHILISWTRV